MFSHHGSNNSCKNLIYSTGKRNKSKLSNQMQQWQEEMNLRFSGKKVPPKYWEYPELEKGNIHKHCAYCIDIHCPKTLNLDSLFMRSQVSLIGFPEALQTFNFKIQK